MGPLAQLTAPVADERIAAHKLLEMAAPHERFWMQRLSSLAPVVHPFIRELPAGASLRAETAEVPVASDRLRAAVGSAKTC